MTRFWPILAVLCCLLPFASMAELGNGKDAIVHQQKRQQWQKAVDDFALADKQTVLTPYMQVIAALNHHPELQWCSDDVLQLAHRALSLNASSLLAYSTLYTCAARKGEMELKAQYLEQINGLIGVLMAGKKADSIDTVIEVRELMEAQLLLQAMGYTVLDVDMLTFYGGLYYRYYVMDPLASKVTIRYFSNLQFMKRLLTNPNVSDDTAAQLLAQHYEQEQADFAVNAQALRLIANRQYDKAEALLGQIESDSMIKNVSLGWIYLSTKRQTELDGLRAELAFDAKSGFVDAAVLLAAIDRDDATKAQHWLSEVDQFTQPGEGAFRLALAMEKSPLSGLRQQSIEWLKRAVDKQHPKATLTLARYYRSQGGTQEERQAMGLFEKALGYGIDEAAIEIARYLHHGSSSVAVDHQRELKILSNLAEKNNATANYLLAQRYESGTDVDKDVTKAYGYYLKSFELGEAKSANQLGILHEIGAVDGKPDMDKAYQWYQRAADKGDSNGFSNLARFNQFGVGREVNLDMAANYYVKAAETGSQVAYCRLADILLQLPPAAGSTHQDTIERAKALYEHGADKEKQVCPRRLGALYQFQLKDNRSAAYWYEVAARNGDRPATNYLEFIFFDSYVDKDYPAALKLLTKGARMGMAKSTYFLGQMYHLGQGIERDDSAAIHYYHKAAELGYPLANRAIIQLLLQGRPSVRDQIGAERMLDKMADASVDAAIDIAEWFFYGWYFDQDYRLALRYYRLAAAKGSGNAINHLGEMYRYGWGVDKDYQQAMRWYLKGVKNHYALAAHNLGEMYYLGEGVKRNYPLALEWFNKSAAANVSHSHYFLGKMYQDGLGVTQDQQAANNHFYQAMDANLPGARFEVGKNMITGRGMSKDPKRGLLLVIEAAEAGFDEALEYLRKHYPKVKIAGAQ